MIERILEFSLRQRTVVLLAVAGLLGIGIWSARELPIDAVPDITQPQVQINTEVRALAPEEAEMLVTRVLEQELAGLPQLSEMRSLTKFGLSQITLQFEDGVDIYRCRQLVAERIQTVRQSLPPGAEPGLAPITTGLGEIFYYTLAWRDDATNRPPDAFTRLLELQETQEYVAKPFLRATPGVAEINSIGGFTRQIVVQPDPDRLREANLTFAELAAVIARNTDNAGGGIIQRGGEQLVVRAATKPTTLDEIADLPVKFAAGVRPLRVRDLAVVRIDSMHRTGAATENGAESVLGTVMMLMGENSRIVAHRIGLRMDELRSRLPRGIEVRVQYDRSNLVDRTVATVKRNLFEGAILVVAVLLFLFGNARAALIVACAIPLSFLAAITGMARFGISGNLMSLGAVDFGLIIDGAVVIVENVVRQLAHRQHHLGRVLTVEERHRIVLTGAKQVGTPVFFGVLIITIVYVPILALAGVEGKMFRPMALTVMLALGGALVLALTLMPVLASFFLGGKIEEKENAVMRCLQRVYGRVLSVGIAHRRSVAAGAVALFAAGIGLFFRLGAEFVPQLDEGSTTFALYRPVGQNLAASIADQIQTEKLVRARFPEVTNVFARIGTAEVATDPMPPNEADFYLSYAPAGSWRKVDGRPISKGALVDEIRKAIEGTFTNTTAIASQPIAMRFNEMLEGVRADLSIKVFGPDFDVLDATAAKIKALLEPLPGHEEIEHETDGRTSMLTITPRRDALARRNLASGALNDAIAVALAGETVGSFAHGSHTHEIVVRLRGDLRDDTARIKALPIRVGEFGLASLGDLADITTVQSVQPIRHEAGRRRVALLVNLNTRDVEGWVRNAQSILREKVPLPDGYIVEFGGQFQRLQDARARLAVVVPATLVLIFVIVFIAFGSVRQALLVYSGIPLAMTGGVIALWCRGMPFSITAAVGFIALSGVAVLDGVVMVSCFNRLREEGLGLLESVREGALSRLRPVLMTALVASLGFVPTAIATGAGAEVQRPLATVVIGGILSSTLLTLVVLPVLYAWFEKEKREPEAGEAAPVVSAH
ncbi:MAG: efflux RND transporter permease subunit [Verrucomicrobia bacterium]|nr:MAG: efflux RND transporter permease subunit [Verrucomicrobiota bacterium]